MYQKHWRDTGYLSQILPAPLTATKFPLQVDDLTFTPTLNIIRIR